MSKLTPREKKTLASLSGQAGAAQAKADKLIASARIPFTGFRDQGVCSVCNQQLKPASMYSVIPHTPKTCPGPAARVSMDASNG